MLPQCLHGAEAEGQPLAANVQRVMQALNLLGTPLPAATSKALTAAAAKQDAEELQGVLDPHVLVVVSLNPEVRVKAARGTAAAKLQQAGYTPVLLKILNDSTATKALHISSPQSGPVYAGVAKLSMDRQKQQKLRENENTAGRNDRFLDVELFTSPPMTDRLSGLLVEYVIALLYSSDAGKREATLAFDVGEGTQDLGFRGEVPVLFDIAPAIEVKLSVKDHDGSPTMGRFLFLDKQGHVFPPQAKRIAPDFFFQKHIYRADGETVLLPPGEFTMFTGRGPEYRWLPRKITVPPRNDDLRLKTQDFRLAVKLERWVNPASHGFYGGDHHIHAAGCAHYTSPTEGVFARDMFRQIKGEALNVGCVLTWGPCFDFQKQFFAATPNQLSEPFTVMKYDVEVSGFGSQALGHVCLLNLKEQIYPGADGSKNWPTWTTPVLRWAKAQGGVVGYAHSASGLQVDTAAAAKRMMISLDADKDGRLSADEAAKGLVPEPFTTADANRDGFITLDELTASHERAADRLPNLAIPELNSVGAQEIFVTASQGLCDFISAMDTARLPEWNCWYHLLNCGLPLKVSGETDFPCMSGTRVGQGRVYVRLGKVDRVDYTAWCEGIRAGRSYVSDGYAHALDFTVNGARSGDDVKLAAPTTVHVKALVAFASGTPLEVYYGGAMPVEGPRLLGDTVNLHETKGKGVFAGNKRRVELIVNGRVAASQQVPADDQEHELFFNVLVERSSWIALRHFPQMHANPVSVLVGGKPIRASRQSALWAVGCIEQLWRVRERAIAPAEREEARSTFEKAKEFYRRIAAETAEDS
ncbi:MAG: CehA/McbA family metallohydrolase [Verrucomicrobia bacterium]|nr:CehA/McbA family metallohydrolase [Verrucomicrobiota bacterium]